MLDPNELFGMAHFCEHMTMVSNEKYPNVNSFEAFLEENGGETSSFTQRDLTAFIMDISPLVLSKSLERFAEYFITPPFSGSVIEEVINSIQEKHESLTKSCYPFSQFDCGNRETLWTQPRAQFIDIREEVMKFYKTNYSANLMSLGRETLESTFESTLNSFLVLYQI